LTTDSKRRQAVILTAVEPETRAVLRHISGCLPENIRGTEFHVGHFLNWKIAVAEIGAGNSMAAAIVERAIQHFEPSVALFVGVAGGVKDVAIGDVVVATKVYGYESGKDKRGFKVMPEVLNTAHALEQRALEPFD
jgi:nucleoside phosphorylase